MDAKYESLFTPWKVGNVEIKNRIVMCPMGGTSLFGWFELTGCHFDKEAAKLFLERADQFGDGPGATHASGQLNEQLGAGFMDFIHENFQFF